MRIVLRRFIVPDGLKVTDVWSFQDSARLKSIVFGDNSQVMVIISHVFRGMRLHVPKMAHGSTNCL